MKKKQILSMFVLVLFLTIRIVLVVYATDSPWTEDELREMENQSTIGLTALQSLVLWMLLIVAFLKLAMKFDDMLNKLGLNVTQTGGRAIGDLMAVGMAMKGLSKIPSMANGAMSGLGGRLGSFFGASGATGGASGASAGATGGSAPIGTGTFAGATGVGASPRGGAGTSPTSSGTTFGAGTMPTSGTSPSSGTAPTSTTGTPSPTGTMPMGGASGGSGTTTPSAGGTHPTSGDTSTSSEPPRQSEEHKTPIKRAHEWLQQEGYAQAGVKGGLVGMATHGAKQVGHRLYHGKGATEAVAGAGDVGANKPNGTTPKDTGTKHGSDGTDNQIMHDEFNSDTRQPIGAEPFTRAKPIEGFTEPKNNEEFTQATPSDDYSDDNYADIGEFQRVDSGVSSSESTTDSISSDSNSDSDSADDMQPTDSYADVNNSDIPNDEPFTRATPMDDTSTVDNPSYDSAEYQAIGAGYAAVNHPEANYSDAQLEDMGKRVVSGNSGGKPETYHGYTPDELKQHGADFLKLEQPSITHTDEQKIARGKDAVTDARRQMINDMNVNREASGKSPISYADAGLDKDFSDVYNGKDYPRYSAAKQETPPLHSSAHSTSSGSYGDTVVNDVPKGAKDMGDISGYKGDGGTGGGSDTGSSSSASETIPHSTEQSTHGQSSVEANPYSSSSGDGSGSSGDSDISSDSVDSTGTAGGSYSDSPTPPPISSESYGGSEAVSGTVVESVPTDVVQGGTVQSEATVQSQSSSDGVGDSSEMTTPPPVVSSSSSPVSSSADSVESHSSDSSTISTPSPASPHVSEGSEAVSGTVVDNVPSSVSASSYDSSSGYGDSGSQCGESSSDGGSSGGVSGYNAESAGYSSSRGTESASSSALTASYSGDSGGVSGSSLGGIDTSSTPTTSTVSGVRTHEMVSTPEQSATSTSSSTSSISPTSTTTLQQSTVVEQRTTHETVSASAHVQPQTVQPQGVYPPTAPAQREPRTDGKPTTPNPKGGTTKASRKKRR